MIASSKLAIAHSPMDFAARNSKFGLTSFYFKGSINTQTPILSSEFAIDIDF